MYYIMHKLFKKNCESINLIPHTDTH